MLLRDGQVAHLRPIGADDQELLVDFYERGLRGVEVPPVLRADAAAVRARRAAVHQRGPRDRVAFVLTVANKMIAVGRFDRIPPEEAKPSRASSRRRWRSWCRTPTRAAGIAQLLLEHLAQAGRERGIDRFVADVLPENRRMMQTFREAGYKVAGGFTDGVMRLVFPIDSHRHLGLRDAGPRAPRRVGVDPAVLRRPQRRGHRRLAPPRHHRADAGAQPGARRLPGPGVRREPGGPVGGRPAGVRRGRRHPRHRRRGDRRGARRGGAGRGARLRRQGRARPGGDLLGLRRDGGGGPAAAAQARRPGPQLRPAADRPELPRHHQHRRRRTR